MVYPSFLHFKRKSVTQIGIIIWINSPVQPWTKILTGRFGLKCEFLIESASFKKIGCGVTAFSLVKSRNSTSSSTLNVGSISSWIDCKSAKWICPLSFGIKDQRGSFFLDVGEPKAIKKSILNVSFKNYLNNTTSEQQKAQNK